MLNLRKTFASVCSALLILQTASFSGLITQEAKAVAGPNYDLMKQYGINENSYFWKKAIWNRTNSNYAKDVVSRPYPRLIGNQWNVLPDGMEDNGDTNKYQDYAAKYFDYIYLNRVRGAYSDKFVDTYDSVKNPNAGLLKYKNNVYSKAQNYGRRCYVLIYHAQEGIENYSPPTSGYTYWFANSSGNPWKTSSNRGTWDIVSDNNAWYRNNDNSYVAYTHYSTSQRRLFDHRKPDMRTYWANHANEASQQFDGIFADNWMRSIGPDSNGWTSGVNQAGGLLKGLWGSDKILVGNGFYLGQYNTRDFGMLEDWSGNWKWDFSESDRFANTGQLAEDTSANASCGSLWDRLARNLMTDDVFGIHDDENGGVVSFVDNYISKLGKIGYPLEDRINLGNGCYKRAFTHGIAYWNNSGGNATVNVPSGLYKDINGNSVQGNVTLANRKGLILKRNGAVVDPTPEPPVAIVPATPSDVAVKDLSKAATSGNIYVNLVWKDNSDNETGFEILQSVNSTTDFKVIKTPKPNSQNYGINIGNSPTAGIYRYKVVALNATGRSADSNAAETKIGELPPPVAPTNLQVTNVEKNSVTGNVFVNLSWSDNSNDEEYFQVYHSINNQDNFAIIKSPEANSASYKLDLGNQPEYGTHYFYIVAANANGKSIPSDTANTEIKKPLPAAPSDVAVKDLSKAATSGNIYVNLVWKDNSDNETSFEILESVNSTNDFKVIKTPKPNSQNYGINVGSAPEYGMRYYKVVALNADVRSEDSNIASAEIKKPTPNAPSDTAINGLQKAAQSGNIYVNLAWKDNSDNETGFEIQESVNTTTDFKVIKTPKPNSQSYGINIGSNPVKGTHYYRVRAVNENGYSEFSNTVSTKI